MIEVKNAVQLAMQYCAQLFGSISVLNKPQLEEVVLSDDEKHWFITVSYDEPGDSQSESLSRAMSGLGPRAAERKYKVVDVDSETGKVRAVTMRQPLERVS